MVTFAAAAKYYGFVTINFNRNIVQCYSKINSLLTNVYLDNSNNIRN